MGRGLTTIEFLTECRLCQENPLSLESMAVGVVTRTSDALWHMDSIGSVTKPNCCNGLVWTFFMADFSCQESCEVSMWICVMRRWHFVYVVWLGAVVVFASSSWVLRVVLGIHVIDDDDFQVILSWSDFVLGWMLHWDQTCFL